MTKFSQVLTPSWGCFRHTFRMGLSFRYCRLQLSSQWFWPRLILQEIQSHVNIVAPLQSEDEEDTRNWVGFRLCRPSFGFKVSKAIVFSHFLRKKVWRKKRQSNRTICFTHDLTWIALSSRIARSTFSHNENEMCHQSWWVHYWKTRCLPMCLELPNCLSMPILSVNCTNCECTDSNESNVAPNLLMMTQLC